MGSRLRTIIENQGRSQIWLAGKVGVSAVTVSRWMRGEQTPSAANVQAIAEALGVPSARFTSLTGDGAADRGQSRRGVPGHVLSALELLQRAEHLIGSARVLLSGDHVEFGDPPPQAGDTGKTGTDDD